jgi:NAD-dependent SIR2 family protein deacetylase
LPFEALRHGATVVEINPQPTTLTNRAHYVLSGAASVVLPEVVASLQNSRSKRSL